MENIPETTVAIAVHNEEKSIREVITRWQREPIAEILIISSASTDRTNIIISEFKEKDPRIRLIAEPEKKGKPNAVNKLLEQATGKIIIMTDGDVLVEKGAAEKLIRHFRKDSKIGLVAGHPIPYATDGIPGIWLKMSCDILHEKRSKNISLDVTGNLYAIKKGTIDKIPEDTTLDDAHIALKVLESGHDIIYEPEAKVLVRGAKTAREYINQKTRTRIGWWQLAKSNNTIVRSPKKELSYIRKTLSYMKTPKGFAAVISYYALNAIAWANAYRIYRTKKDYLKTWKPIESTK